MSDIIDDDLLAIISGEKSVAQNNGPEDQKKNKEAESIEPRETKKSMRIKKGEVKSSNEKKRFQLDVSEKTAVFINLLKVKLQTNGEHLSIRELNDKIIQEGLKSLYPKQYSEIAKFYEQD